MEPILCCLSCVVCFWSGVWAAGGMRLPHRHSRRSEQITETDGEDALSRDIAALMAYTIPGREKTDETE
ncbi:MAG: hypothetical protein Q4F79_04525 [Eubacteriales bacterium]|nr:hypothetical protein [Eubacteriales bacterium]